MRVGAVCPLNLCLKNLTFDSCAALSHPMAHIQCGPVCRGSAEEVSVITTACTTFCTSLPSPILTSLPSFSEDPQLTATAFRRTFHVTKPLISRRCLVTDYSYMFMFIPSLPLLQSLGIRQRVGTGEHVLLSVFILAQQTRRFNHIVHIILADRQYARFLFVYFVFILHQRNSEIFIMKKLFWSLLALCDTIFWYSRKSLIRRYETCFYINISHLWRHPVWRQTDGSRSRCLVDKSVHP